MKTKIMVGIAGIVGVAAGALLAGQPGAVLGEADAAHHRATGIAVIRGTEGNEDIHGTVNFMQSEDGVQIEAHITGLSDGKHGFHIHQLGDISAADGTSAGGHYNPHGVDHACPEAGDARHVGDMGNIESSDGHATYERTDNLIKLEGEDSVIGRAVVIHGGEDDCESQPSGAAGARVAVGVIGLGERK